jgi:hypothetical protein
VTRGKSRQPGIPPMRCTAPTKTRGRTCRRWALVGQTVCDIHGGKAPQAQAAADRRDAFAQVMQWEDPDAPRPLGEVMLEAVHNADVLQRSLRDVRLRVARGEAVAGEELDRLVRMSQVAHALAETTVRAGVQVELVRQARLETEMNAAAVVRVLARVLDALTSGPRAPLAPLGPDFIGELRVWLHEVVRAELDVVAAVDDPDPNESELVTGAPRGVPAAPGATRASPGGGPAILRAPRPHPPCRCGVSAQDHTPAVIYNTGSGRSEV